MLACQTGDLSSILELRMNSVTILLRKHGSRWISLVERHKHGVKIVFDLCIYRREMEYEITFLSFSFTSMSDQF